MNASSMQCAYKLKIVKPVRRNFTYVPVWNKGKGIIKQPVYTENVAEGVVNAIFEQGNEGLIYQAVGVGILWLTLGALLGLSDSVAFGCFMQDDQDGAETALAEIRPTTENLMRGAPALRDVNREAPPQVAPICAATVGESVASSLPSS
ncbi:hypothetical protein HPB51_013068 [Rhipicephalus microplus]|uniref:Uncharacterized protein n=1 Tax=Rhipicephalus microplus TaxID=6941 RepID=A0A9J6F2B7_RHIMP|nr:hypothetical protein HPB51_013068 [Rhipicephalus microplus]